MTNIYKAAQEYLSAICDVQPQSDEAPEKIPVITLNVTQTTSVRSLWGEALPETTIKCGVWAKAYISVGEVEGVLDLADALHSAMTAKHYLKAASSDPYRDADGKWHVDVTYTKKTKTF